MPTGRAGVRALLLSLASLSWALPPYTAGTKQAAGEVKAQIEQVERKLQAEGFTGLVRLDAIAPADTTGEDAEALRDSIAIRAQQTLAQDSFQLFTNALSNEAGIQIDQSAVKS